MLGAIWKSDHSSGIDREACAVSDSGDRAGVSEKSADTELPETEALAFLGDAVMHLMVRLHVLRQQVSISQMHDQATGYVRASAQSEMLKTVMGMLTEEEISLVKRSRNRAGRGPRKGDATDYRQATAFEALLGYLLLNRKFSRINLIWKAAMEHGGQKKENKRIE